MNDKIDVALNVVKNEIDDLSNKAFLAAIAISNNPDLIEAVASGDRDEIIEAAITLNEIAPIDYATVMDTSGYVIIRTNEPESYGDNMSHLPHVDAALTGRTIAYIMQGPTVLLGVSAGAPLYDDDHNFIGVISIGFKLNSQDFVLRMSALTGCEVSIFRDDERVASTVLNEDGTFALGTKANETISEQVLTGTPYTGRIELFGRDVLAHYSALYGRGNEAVGMVFVGFYTAEDTNKILLFVGSGILITLLVLLISIFLAGFISGAIEKRLNSMMRQISEREEELARINGLNELQLLMLNTVVKAMRLALWDMEVDADDSVGSENKIIWSKEFRELLGFTNEEDFPNILDSWIYRLHPEDKERAVSALANHMLDTSGRTPFDIEYRMLKKNGEYSFYRAAGDTIRDKDGNPVRVAGALMDVTGERNLQLTLENERSTLQTMFDSIPDMIFCKNLDMKYTRCNNSLLEFYNLTADHFLGKTDVEGLNIPQHILDEHDQIDHEVINKNKIVTREELLPDLSGNIRIFETTRVPLLRKGEVTGFMGIARDITERKEMEEAAQSANRSKSLFLANMSHEIRTPMNSIIGLSELAQDDEITDKTRSYFESIQDSAEWLLNIINDILDISKIESGHIEFESIPFDLPDVFAQCQTAIMPKITEKGIMLYCYAEPSIGKKLLGDPVRLRQVIMNLLSNAVKFTNAGTVKFLASIISSDKKSVTVQFEIRDSGIGMTAEQIAKVFNPFTQADDSITRRFGGTGLGLTITSNILKLMGGTLEVESTPGVGSKFSFILKFDMIEDAELPAKDIRISDFERPNFNGEILVCEDNSLNQRVIREHLSKVGIKTVIANNGKEGVDIVAERIRKKKKPFDLIFMDIHMPVMDGLDASSIIMDMGVKTPVIALTANVMSNDLELYRINGMYDTVGKPFTSQELWKCLAKYLTVESYTTIDKRRQHTEKSKSQKMIKTNFIVNNQTTYNDIIASLDNDDIATAYRAVHTLKSNAGLIGEKRLQTLAAETEDALTLGKEHLNEKMMQDLKDELSRVLTKLAPLLLETRDISKLENVDTDKAIKLLNDLEPLLKSRDMKCLKLLDDLHFIPGSELLIKQIEGLKFKQALETLKKIKDKMVSANE